MANKDLFVILAFHAHEPWWDLPAHILRTIDDEEMRESIPADNWVRRRAEADRDVYADLLRLGERLSAPLCLEATNELLMQLDEFSPQTIRALRQGFNDGALYPIYGGAHHTHTALLTVDELADELRLNQEYLHDVLGAPLPRRRGAFPMEGSIDAHKLEAFRRAGMEYVVFPHLNPRKAHYRLDGEGDPTYEPFLLDHDIIALPRHFAISQEIWRPITRWKPDGLKMQGYILGDYWVFDDEYREERYVKFPIDREDAVREYRAVIDRSVDEAPDGGLLLYIQDLELMDYGEEALEILGEAWEGALAGEVNVHFVTPDEYLDAMEARGHTLPRLRFHQISWAPEIRPVLRCDGHYPPLDAGPFRDVDLSLDVFQRWPFIFWEWGRFHVEIVNSLLRSFGHALVLPLSAREWWERGYRYEGLDTNERLALHARVLKQADNWGWRPEEGRQKRPYLHMHRIVEMLLAELEETDRANAVAASVQPLNARSLIGMERLLEPFIGVRIAYLRNGIERLGERAGEHVSWAHHHLARAEERRREATDALHNAREANERLASSASPSSPDAIAALLASLRDHCRHAFLATDEIQRAWGSIEDTEGMVVEMYRYLYDLYPPLLPTILRELATPEELAALDAPELV